MPAKVGRLYAPRTDSRKFGRNRYASMGSRVVYAITFLPTSQSYYRPHAAVSDITGNMSNFNQGLRMLAQILLEEETNKGQADVNEGSLEGTSVDVQQEQKLAILSELTDFVTLADQLLKAKKVTVKQYATLVCAIFMPTAPAPSHPMSKKAVPTCAGSEYQLIDLVHDSTNAQTGDEFVYEDPRHEERGHLLYTAAFIEAIGSKDLEAEERRVLKKYGEDHAHEGLLVVRAAYRFA